MIEASAKNRAAKASLVAAEQVGAAHKAEPGEKKTVWFMDNGQKVEYVVTDPFVMTAITSLEYAGMRNGIMGGTMNLPGRGGRKISVEGYKICQKLFGFN